MHKRTKKLQESVGAILSRRMALKKLAQRPDVKKKLEAERTKRKESLEKNTRVAKITAAGLAGTIAGMATGNPFVGSALGIGAAEAARRWTKPVNEEAPVNNAGSGEIAGIGVGAKGEPGVTKKRQKKWQNANAEEQGILRRQVKKLAPPLEEGRFAGHKTFKVPTSTIVNTRYAKKKNGHWSKFLPEDNIGYAIREWANAHPNAPVILEDDIGNIIFVRYGKQ